MSNLENIVEINTAIKDQKKDGKPVLKIVKDFLDRPEIPSDFISKAKYKSIDQILSPDKINEALFEQKIKQFGEVENKTYELFQQFSGYISKIKDKVYGYYTSVKDTLKALKDSLKIGYTDKLLKEMEDWGYFQFSTVFRKLNRLTLLGSASRYLQEIYVAVVKTIKH